VHPDPQTERKLKEFEEIILEFEDENGKKEN